MRAANLRLWGILALASSPFLIGDETVAAQASATLEITARAALDNRPLPGAQVFVEGLGMQGVTNGNGIARITGVPPGTRRVQVRYLGYAPADERLPFTLGRTTRVDALLDLQPIALEEVKVEGVLSRLMENGFYERQAHGIGVFFTREDIERQQPRFLSDMVRQVPGVQIPSLLQADRRPTRIRGSNPICTIQYVINGLAELPGYQLDYVPPMEVEGMEIYKGAAGVPPAFNGGTSACGTIVIWTRFE